MLHGNASVLENCLFWDGPGSFLALRMDIMLFVLIVSAVTLLCLRVKIKGEFPVLKKLCSVHTLLYRRDACATNS